MRDDWRDHSLCWNEPAIVEIMFGPTDRKETKNEEWTRVRTATGICGGCDARVDCLEYAMKTKPERGVWGGFSADAITRALRTGTVLVLRYVDDDERTTR